MSVPAYIGLMLWLCACGVQRNGAKPGAQAVDLSSATRAIPPPEASPSLPPVVAIIEREPNAAATELTTLVARAPIEYASLQAACLAIVPPQSALTGPGVACAPFRSKRTCQLARVAGNEFVRVEVTDTLPTEHCATYPGAPRADLTSVFLAPAFWAGKRLRVARDSMVSAEYVFGMARMLSGAIDAEAPKKLSLPSGASATALTFSLTSAEHQFALILCEQSGRWCTDMNRIEIVSAHEPGAWDLRAIPHTSRLRLTRPGDEPKVFVIDFAMAP
jgi:hypothetical protein